VKSTSGPVKLNEVRFLRVLINSFFNFILRLANASCNLIEGRGATLTPLWRRAPLGPNRGLGWFEQRYL
jgi:hypothetical protein